MSGGAAWLAPSAAFLGLQAAVHALVHDCCCPLAPQSVCLVPLFPSRSALTSGMSLTLSPWKPAAAAARKRKGASDGEAAAGGTIEQIEKVGGMKTPDSGQNRDQVISVHPLLPARLPQIVHVRQPGSLEMRQRSVRQLSGDSPAAVSVAAVLPLAAAQPAPPHPRGIGAKQVYATQC